MDEKSFEAGGIIAIVLCIGALVVAKMFFPSLFVLMLWIVGIIIALMIVLATLVGIIPESGPHMIFVTLYAAGVVPLPVLLASSISQDGHSSLPLIAENRKSFLWAKLINCITALLVGFTAMLI